MHKSVRHHTISICGNVSSQQQHRVCWRNGAPLCLTLSHITAHRLSAEHTERCCRSRHRELQQDHRLSPHCTYTWSAYMFTPLRKNHQTFLSPTLPLSVFLQPDSWFSIDTAGRRGVLVAAQPGREEAAGPRRTGGGLR